MLCGYCGCGRCLLIRFLLLLLTSVATAAGPLVRAAHAAAVDLMVGSLVESEGMSVGSGFLVQCDASYVLAGGGLRHECSHVAVESWG